MSKRRCSELRSPAESQAVAQSSKPRISAQATEGWLWCAGEARRKLGLALLDCSLQPLKRRLKLVATRVCNPGQPRQGVAVSCAQLSDRFVRCIPPTQVGLDACEPS